MVVVHKDYDENQNPLNANYTKSGQHISEWPKEHPPSGPFLMWRYDLCADLIERYEARNNIKFDSIFLARLDGWWPERSPVFKPESMKIHGRIINYSCGYGISLN